MNRKNVGIVGVRDPEAHSRVPKFSTVTDAASGGGPIIWTAVFRH